jgi:3-deoxy-7-phosphoheptulonate synthase
MSNLAVLVTDKINPPPVDVVIGRLVNCGHEVQVIQARGRTMLRVCARGAPDLAAELRTWPQVEKVFDGEPEMLLAGRALQQEHTVVDVGGAAVGDSGVAVIAGPCSMDGPDTLLRTAAEVRAAGATMLRVGLFKPRTSPYSFQGPGRDGFEAVKEARRLYGLPVVTEVLGVRDIEDLLAVADVLQVGTRNMQNFPLLTELGKAGRPVLLKRGLSATLHEWLCAAEYVLANGNPDVILCERGIRTFETSTRFTLDINAIPVVKELSHLPIIVDPSHGTGHARYVPAVACAGLAAGADGLIIEVHAEPERALSDAEQALDLPAFTALMRRLRAVAASVDREIAPAPPIAASARISGEPAGVLAGKPSA